MIKKITAGPFQTNTYIVSSENKAILIDPTFDIKETVLDYLKAEKLSLEAIWLTHSHLDHIAGAKELIDLFNIPIFVHPLDEANLKNPGADKLPLFFPIEGVSRCEFFEEGSQLSVGNYTFSVITTPGHTPGGVCFFEKKELILFSGDTLFKGTIGNLNFPTANAEKMWTSLKKLATLPPSTRVFPGHGPSTTIGQESWLADAEQFMT